MGTLAQTLTELVVEGAARAGLEVPAAPEPCVPCGNPEHGDYQSNLAFRMAKAARRKPQDVAAALKDAIGDDPRLVSVEVAGPGFLNFRLTDAAVAADLDARAADPWLGTPRVGEGRTMVIDYSSPNIAKRMHVGHLRSTVIGNALDRAHRFLGWRVIADNHIGDWGTQYGKLIVMWDEARDDAAFAADPVGELQRLYQRFGEREKEDPALIDAARAETAKLQRGDPRNVGLWKTFVDTSLVEFDRVYKRLGVSFDVVHGESFYRDRLDAMVEKLLADGVAEESDGAVIVRLEGKLSNPPMLLRKRDGAALYATTDLATIAYREETWDPELCVYVVDVRQKLHFEQVFATAAKLGFRARLAHVWFGMLKLADGQVVASRAAGTSGSLNLVDVFDTAVAHARRVVDELSGHLPDDERAQIAEVLGVGAIRLADLTQNPQTDIVFDWDKMLSLDGRTATYLAYNYARVRSLFRKAGLDDAWTPGPIRIGHPSERALGLEIARLPESVLDAASTWRPNVIADRLFAIAGAFSAFYRDCPVLKDDVPADVRASRLALAHLTARALATGMRLLGVEPLERL